MSYLPKPENNKWWKKIHIKIPIQFKQKLDVKEITTHQNKLNVK
jgi:hypothetical protein